MVELTHRYFRSKASKDKPELQDEVAELEVVCKIVADRMEALRADLKDQTVSTWDFARDVYRMYA